MTILTSPAALWLVQSVSRDTVLVRQVPPVRTWFDQAVNVASGLTTLLLLLLACGLLWGMIAARRSIMKAHAALDRRMTDFGKRMDDFNDLLGKVHRQADSVVDVAETAVSGLKWGAGVMRRRRKKRKPREGDIPEVRDLDADAGETGRGGGDDDAGDERPSVRRR